MIKNKSYTKEVNKMVTYDLVIKSGKVVSSQGVFEAHIFVLDGKIARISRVLDTENAERTLDASGLLVFPGFIDSPTFTLETRGLLTKKTLKVAQRAPRLVA